ncbi:MAG: hypothetical protein ABIG91_00525 [Patescibacteria group bacterium]
MDISLEKQQKIREEEEYRQAVRKQIEAEGNQNKADSKKGYEQKVIRVEGKKTQELDFYLLNGWTIKSKTTLPQGWAVGKTALLGLVFLPLALLGRKPNVVEYVIEKNNI